MGRKGKTAAKENCESGQKPKRSPNYLPSEKELLLKLVKQRIDVLENKKTDAVSNEERDAGWAALTTEFNAESGIHERKMESLKDRWDNLKREAKKAAAAEKVETFKTGGGTRAPGSTVSAEQAKVLELLGPAGVGFPSAGDGDKIVGILDTSAEIQIDQELSGFSVVKGDTDPPMPGPSWGNGSVCPRIYYQTKPPSLKVGGTTSNPQGGDSNSSSKAGDTTELKKRTLQEEVEWSKAAKRRRPTLNTSAATETQVKLMEARIALTMESKKQMETEAARKEAQEADEAAKREELFQIEKKKKEMEAKLVELQVKKLMKEMGEM